jgi:hypothetical protein
MESNGFGCAGACVVGGQGHNGGWGKRGACDYKNPRPLRHALNEKKTANSISLRSQSSTGSFAFASRLSRSRSQATQTTPTGFQSTPWLHSPFPDWVTDDTAVDWTPSQLKKRAVHEGLMQRG